MQKNPESRHSDPRYTDPGRSESGLPLLVALIIGLLFFGAYLAVERFSETGLPSLGTALGFLSAYVVLASATYIIFRLKGRTQHSEQAMLESLNTKMHNMFKYNVDLPYAISDEHGRIRVTNTALQLLLGAKDPFYRGNVSDICCGVSLQDMLDTSTKEKEAGTNAALLQDANQQREKESLEQTTEREVGRLEHGTVVHMKNGRRYIARAYSVELNKKPNYLITFTDTTDFLDLKEKNERDMPAVAYIDVDNLEELTQHTRVNYRDASRQVDDVLIRFAAHVNGLLREYERDRYILLFSQEKLRQCENDKFSELLDGIRNIRLGEYSIPVTVSVGISLADATMEERAKDAGTALDMALQRGGDQVAVRRRDGIQYYGGQTRPFQRRTKVQSRVVANYLLTQISEADNLLLMGHKNPDFDSIASCLGLAQLGLLAGVPTHIIMDLNNANFKTATERLTASRTYRDMFISGHKGLDKIKPGTLLILCDVNNFNIIEAPDVAANVKQISGKIAIVDHHRQTGEYDFEPVLNHIDPSASSAAELVTEMLEQSDTGSDGENNELVSHEVASIILSGIVLDTHNFTRNTGSRTLDAARYLFGKGANVEYVHKFFNEDYNDYVCNRSFSSCTLLHDGQVGLTWSKGTGQGGDRVAASKAADNLLNVKDVHAAFALVKIDNTIHISGRSDGSINVQLILERMGGGGRYDTAGAQVADTTLDIAKNELCKVIDTYFAELEENK